MAKMFLFRGTNELMGSLIAAKVYRNIARLLDGNDSDNLQIPDQISNYNSPMENYTYTELAE